MEIFGFDFEIEMKFRLDRNLEAPQNKNHIEGERIGIGIGIRDEMQAEKACT